jgi:drug/metabolite transporter (DMT)-like permease
MSKPVGFITFNEFTLVRSVFMMAVSYLILTHKIKVKVSDVATDHQKMLFARSLFGTAALLTSGAGTKLLPLSMLTLIMSTNPFLTAALQYFWLGARVSNYDLFAMVGSIGGIVIMSVSAPASENDESSSAYILGLAMATTATVCMSFIYVSTSRLRSVHYLLIAFWVGLATTIVCIGGLVIEYFIQARSPFTDVGLLSLIVLLCVSVANFAAINLLSLAL